MSSLTRSVTNRVVHLRITPRPSNLGESREIMRLLSAFGEIEYYKNLRYDSLPAPTAALVMYKDASAALECLQRSPIRFRMGRAPLWESQGEGEKDSEMEKQVLPTDAGDTTLPRGPLGTPFGLGKPSHTRSMSTQHSPLPAPPTTRTNISKILHPTSQAPPLDDSRIFQIQVNPSFRHLRDHINVNHYHGSFAIDTKMFGQGDLAKKVPTPGLSCVDWKAPERPWHVVRTEREREKGAPIPRKRLGQLYEEGQQEQERGEHAWQSLD